MTRQGSRARWLGDLRRPVATGLADPFVGLLLAAAYTALLLATVKGLGYARDEGFYFDAARSYERWFELLWTSPGQAVARADDYWRVNAEHPALVKSLFALSHHVLFEKWGWFATEGTSYRFPAMVLSGLGVGLVYLWGTRAHGRLCGVVAAASLGAMPHFFFHAHLACFDAPVVTMWTACAYCYWRTLGRGGVAWPFLTGVAFGLALNTKHNAWFLPIACLAHAGLMLVPARFGGIARRTLARRALGAALAMAVVGPLLWLGTWPWLWRDTFARLGGYARFHLEHVYYNMEFLGVNYWQPPMPRGYAWLMTAATVPGVTLAAFFFGLGAASRRAFAGYLRASLASLLAFVQQLRAFGRTEPTGRSTAAPSAGPARTAPGALAGSEAPPVGEGSDPGAGAASFWLLAIAVQYAAWLSPRTPIFGGTKHWMTAYPFLALFAGLGVLAAVEGVARLWPRAERRPGGAPLLELGFGASVLVAPVLECAHAHPWGLSSYTPLVGGAAGAATLGLNRGFWGYQTGALAPQLDALAPPRARVFLHDTAWPAWDMLLRDGAVRRDLRGETRDVGAADLAIYHHEMHMAGVEYQTWVAFGTVVPVQVAGLDGVPVVWLYRRDAGGE
ncbi:MAG: glycosyltransferase family 39 protein [Myxococcales bacterium]|nr:glycosyltransferase family 39 protein [Myxococcales bacterium]